MASFATRLVERREVAVGTMAFAFERPPDFQFAAGQYIVLVLPDPPYVDSKGDRRTFSIASPPQNSGRMEIATRMTGSALKRSLAEVPLGTRVELSGPSGSFTLHADGSVPSVFIAGGIGITPFRSMTLDAIARGLPHRIQLIYSNRKPESAAFHVDFRKLSRGHPALTYIPTMTEAESSGIPWNGERRMVTGDFLREYVGDLGKPIFYIAGPPGLVTGLTKAVIEAGVDPDRVRSEEFEGYP